MCVSSLTSFIFRCFQTIHSFTSYTPASSYTTPISPTAAGWCRHQLEVLLLLTLISPAHHSLRVTSAFDRLCGHRLTIMHSSAPLLGLLAFSAATTSAQSTIAITAPVATGNPQGAQDVATLPNNVTPNGAIVVSSTTDSNGVAIQANINNLPSSGGPFCKPHDRSARTSPALTQDSVLDWHQSSSN